MKKFIVFLSTFIVATGAIAQSNIYDLTDTWNDAGTTFDGIKLTVTDTASQADSKFLHFVLGTSKWYLSKTGSMFIEERADADADVAGYGQLWVNTAEPNELFFTDDAGTDFQLGTGISNLVEDITPQLGGELDFNGFDITAIAPTTDTATADRTISGQSAYASAVTNQSASDLILKMGDHATGGGTAGTVQIQGPDATVHFEVNEAGEFDGTTFRTDETSRNIVIGEGAGASIIAGSGTSNVIIGQQAGNAIDTEDNNIIIGDFAGWNLGGSHNTVIGESATPQASSTYAVSIGVDAGGTSSSVAIGRRAMESATSAAFGNVAIGEDSLASASMSGDYNTAVGYGAGDALTSASYGIFLGQNARTTDTTSNYQIKIGNNTNSEAAFISGFTPANVTDSDITAGVTISGPSANRNASTNIDGGPLILQGGSGAVNSVGDADGANVVLKAGTGYGTGSDGKIQVDDVLNVNASYTVATLPTGAVGDVVRITDGDAALAWGATAVNSGSGTTPYLVWYNGTNWTVIGK